MGRRQLKMFEISLAIGLEIDFMGRTQPKIGICGPENRPTIGPKHAKNMPKDYKISTPQTVG